MLFKDLFDDFLDDGSSGSIGDQLNELNLVGLETWYGDGLFKEIVESASYWVT